MTCYTGTEEPEITGLDPYIAPIVQALRAYRIATYESCDGGPGHSYGEPTVAFRGSFAEGFRALSVAFALDLPVRDLRRVWKVIRGEPGAPVWEMTFWRPIDRKTRRLDASPHPFPSDGTQSTVEAG